MSHIQFLSPEPSLEPRQGPSSTASAISDLTPTTTSFTSGHTSISSPAASNTESKPQPSPTSSSAGVQLTFSSFSTPDEQTSSSATSPASSPTPIQTLTSDSHHQFSYNPFSSIINTYSESVISPFSSSQPASNTFSRPPSAPSQAPPKIVIVTSSDYRTSTDPTGGVHTLITYVDVPENRTVTTISTSGDQPVAQLHDADAHPPGFFDNQGAVIGTFLTVGLIVLGGSAAIIWRLARLRRARLRARQENDVELKFDKFLVNDDDGRVAMLPLETENDDFQTIPLNHSPQHPQINGPQFGPHFSHEQARDPKLAYLDHPGYSNVQETHPVRYSNCTNITGRSSDLDTMNTEEWSRYINTNFPNGGGRAFEGGNKSELVRVDEESAVPAGPQIIISSEDTDPTAATHLSSLYPPPADVQPDIRTVEQETFRMVSPSQFALEDRITRADERLEATVLPGYKVQRPRSDHQDELSSLRDEQDYSRRILRVSNPDREENENQHNTTQT